MAIKDSQWVMRFRVEMTDIEPAIWRLIEVPAGYSFWDLHVAIQDAMGWLDYHLHAFTMPNRGHSGFRSIGIPDPDFDDDTVAGWELPIQSVYAELGDALQYEYDFGDSWMHRVALVGKLLKTPGQRYPRCLEGARACPPEDCGSVSGYYSLLDILADPNHEDYEFMVGWLKGHARSYWPYDPNHFDPAEVKFESPKKRFKLAFP
ncbi:plasmid pRiA4b ORF-3 family protein [Spiribacter onubensis]|uniref:Plasmid pRiA4b ORF-3 family protein n=1 Tax=Spiribacter onubensis TaxID=3122420 RepID=A0ABV3S794_9GAMM